MGWNEVSMVSLRREFVSLASGPGANVRELCRRYGVSPSTAYKWIERGAEESETYEDRSRRPLHSPNKTDAAMEGKILEVRDGHPVWNARKIRRVLQNRGEGPPAASTIGQVLKRNGRISEAASEAAQPWQRFEHPAPNELSQIDFKGFIDRPGQVLPADHARRPLALFPDSEGVRERANRDGPTPPDRELSPIRTAAADEHGQRQPLGYAVGRSAHAPDCMADPARCAGQPFTAVSSTDERKGRTISSDVEGRGARHALVLDP